MKDSKKLRYLDRYFGSIICLLFSLIQYFKVGRKRKPIKNILVVELFEMGAAIMIHPSLLYIKEKYPDDSPYMYGPIGAAVILYEFFQCSPCISAFNHKTSRCNNNLCLQAITPERVFDFAVKVIEGKVRLGTINGEVPYY